MRKGGGAMTIIKPGKKQLKYYAMFKCSVCECEWAEETKKINWVKRNFDQMLMIDHTEYIMRCPCCSTQTATHKVDLIALEEGGAVAT